MGEFRRRTAKATYKVTEEGTAQRATPSVSTSSSISLSYVACSASSYGTAYATRTYPSISSSTTSSASSILHPQRPPGYKPPPRPTTAYIGKAHTPGQQAMEQHLKALIQQALLTYQTSLTPSSQCDHGLLRNEPSGYLSDVMTSMTGTPFSGHLGSEQFDAFNATQLQTMTGPRERI